MLLVDDEPLVRKALIRELERDFELLEAGTCEEAKAILEKTPNIRAVVSDCHMGRGESGIDLLRHAAQAHPDLGRIVVSGSLEAAEGNRLVDDGVVHVFLKKPWNRCDLLAALRLRTSPTAGPT